MPLWFIIVLLGIVEGITEFLPVSSTGHLLIVEAWLGSHQSDLFNVVIQAGAVLAVLPLFPDRLKQFTTGWGNPATLDYALKIAVAFVITGGPGLILEKRGLKLPEHLEPVAIALLLGGIGFLAVEGWLRGKPMKSEVTWTIAIAVGVGQLIAGVFPGTSRSGATILFCLILGLNRMAATEFSFLVGIPTMLAASGWKIFKALRHPVAGAPPEHWDMIALAFVVSAVVSFVAVKWLLGYVRTHTFVAFGWYRIAMAAVVGLMLLMGKGKNEETAPAPKAGAHYSPAPTSPAVGSTAALPT